MKRLLIYILAGIALLAALYFTIIYFWVYSDGHRSGELVKFSHKGVLVKTWEGQISQGMSGTNIFSFSVMDQEAEIIEKLKEYQGEYVKLEYHERFDTFFWWGDTRYFIVDVEKSSAPYFRGDRE